MLKHGRAGVPMEVMGLMLGEFVDEYTGEVDICQLYPFRKLWLCSWRKSLSVRVIDVFAMPQSGTGVSVEAVDPVFQVNIVIEKADCYLHVHLLKSWFSGENVGHVETDWSARNGCWLVGWNEILLLILADLPFDISRYHSHPGFGCWLSGVDINTQQSFEALSDRSGHWKSS